MVEQLICNQQVRGSSPFTGSIKTGSKILFYNLIWGRFPERPKGADCKSVAFQLRWFESIIFHQKKKSIDIDRCFSFYLHYLPLTFKNFYDILIFVQIFEMWLSLVERYVRDVEVVGSNPVISTIKKSENSFRIFTLFLLIYIRYIYTLIIMLQNFFIACTLPCHIVSTILAQSNSMTISPNSKQKLFIFIFYIKITGS